MPSFIERLESRAEIIRGLRHFFESNGYLEVETPCLIDIPSMEPHIDPFEVCGEAGRYYLRTSPEYAIKKLLAKGVRNVFTLGPCFRDEPSSALHQPEFTMLEWYAAERTLQELMDETEQLIRHLWVALGHPKLEREAHEVDLAQPFGRVSMSELWKRELGFCPIEANTLSLLSEAANDRKLRFSRETNCYDALFHQLFLNHIEPCLARSGPTFVYGWPASQSALARLDPNDMRTALRFELYAGGLELANAFDELTDAAEQRQRLQAERTERAAMGKPIFPMDETFLAALPKIPSTVGIALGVDRLVMLLLNADDIREVRL